MGGNWGETADLLFLCDSKGPYRDLLVEITEEKVLE